MGDRPLTCGDLDMSPDQGIQFVEAFIYAIKDINRNFAPSHGLLRGVSLGALGFDDCMSPVLSNQLITEVQRYAYRVTDENGENMLDPRTIEGYLGGGNDKLAVGIANQMNQIHKPVMIYQAYTEELEKEMYHYYIRNHYNVRVFAKTIVLALIRNGWKYVQSVYEDDMYSEEYNRVFRRVAAEEGICVVASHKIAMNNGAQVVDDLRGRPNVRPVIILAGYHGFRTFMQGVKDRGAAGEFHFISTIGDSRKTVEDFKMEADGMLSIRLWAPTGAYTGLRDHLRSINVETYKTNPWYKEWYEKMYDCSFDATGSQNMCTVKSLFDDMELNEKVITVIYGMQAFAYALDRTLKHYCGNGKLKGLNYELQKFEHTSSYYVSMRL